MSSSWTALACVAPSTRLPFLPALHPAPPALSLTWGSAPSHRLSYSPRTFLRRHSEEQSRSFRGRPTGTGIPCLPFYLLCGFEQVTQSFWASVSSLWNGDDNSTCPRGLLWGFDWVSPHTQCRALCLAHDRHSGGSRALIISCIRWLLLLLLDPGSFIFLISVNSFLVSLPFLSNLDTILHHSRHTHSYPQLSCSYFHTILFYPLESLNAAGEHHSVSPMEPAILGLHPQLGPQLCLVVLSALVGTISISPEFSTSLPSSEIISPSNSSSDDLYFTEKVEVFRRHHLFLQEASPEDLPTSVSSACLSSLSPLHSVHNFIGNLSRCSNKHACLSVLLDQGLANCVPEAWSAFELDKWFLHF